MSGVLERAVQFFVAPAAPRAAAAIAPSARAAVLGRAEDAVPLAAAVALALRAAEGAPAALVAVWGGEVVPRGAATRAAARLAGRLDPAIARGRLAWLALPEGPSEAAAAVRRVAAVVDGPLVTALAGARPPELDLLVAEHDLAVLAADPAAPLARTAIAALAGHGVPATACPPLRRGPRRALALAGLAAPRLDIRPAGREVA
jgi:hypothetical protein